MKKISILAAALIFALPMAYSQTTMTDKDNGKNFKLKKTSRFTVMTDKDNGKNFTLKKTSRFTVLLSNIGDAGYEFIQPAYDTVMFKLVSHTHTNPPEYKTDMVGDFGKDKWIFEAIQSGESRIQILMDQPWMRGKEGPTVDFSATIKVL